MFMLGTFDLHCSPLEIEASKHVKDAGMNMSAGHGDQPHRGLPAIVASQANAAIVVSHSNKSCGSDKKV